jgi:hypothetical protein
VNYECTATSARYKDFLRFVAFGYKVFEGKLLRRVEVTQVGLMYLARLLDSYKYVLHETIVLKF